MKFGIRECTDITFRAKAAGTFGSMSYVEGQPVLYIESAKTSSLEQASTTVYATGGRGNSRLVAWEGEKTLTFTVEDALLSPVGFAILSGAGLFNQGTDAQKTSGAQKAIHKYGKVIVSADSAAVSVSHLVTNTDATIVTDTSKIFVLKDGTTSLSVASVSGQTITLTTAVEEDTEVMVDFYELVDSTDMYELVIDAGHFAGNWYVEANTLVRDTDGNDYAAILTLPNVKIQSNFTFTMASSGDPSTFTFTMDAMPGKTYWKTGKEVLCAFEIVGDPERRTDGMESVMVGN